MIEKAFKLLYPDREFNYISNLKYSNRFSDFNANIKKSGDTLEVGLSSKWKDIGEEIKIGLIQHLLMRMFKDKKDTFYTELYESFIKNLAKYTPRIESDPFLKQSFNRVNEKYFNGLIEQPNLKWGRKSTTQLGVYNFHNDTITISSIFKDEEELLDYIMYHELLHKKEKFQTNKGNMRYHTSNFRKLEKKFEDLKEIEKKINLLIKQQQQHTRRRGIWKYLP